MKMLYYQGVLLPVMVKFFVVPRCIPPPPPQHVVFPNSVNVCLYVQIAVSRYASGHYT